MHYGEIKNCDIANGEVQDHEMILHAIELAKEAGLQICLDVPNWRP